MAAIEIFQSSISLRVDEYRTKHKIIFESESESKDDCFKKKRSFFNRSLRSQSLRMPKEESKELLNNKRQVNNEFPNDQKQKGLFHTSSFVRKCLKKDVDLKIQSKSLQHSDWVIYESRALSEPHIMKIYTSEVKIQLEQPNVDDNDVVNETTKLNQEHVDNLPQTSNNAPKDHVY